MADPIRLALSSGDPNGVGPEVLALALAALPPQPEVQFIAYGPGRMLMALGLPEQVRVVDVAPDFHRQAGVAARAAGAVALDALRAAVDDVQQGRADALVTLPIDKATTHGPDFPYSGHTDYLAQAFAGQALMLMVHEALRVALVTTHLPLRAVADALSTARILDQILRLSHALQQDFGLAQPRLAVLGLNPHAGDAGLLGSEEAELIAPAIAQAHAAGLAVEGPFAADGFFQFEAYRRYDGILAMYHDQGLVPFKALAGGRGVNVTAGLSLVRTSPDHGTAYDLAGTGRADARSTADAILLAIDIVRRRRALL